MANQAGKEVVELYRVEVGTKIVNFDLEETAAEREAWGFRDRRPELYDGYVSSSAMAD